MARQTLNCPLIFRIEAILLVGRKARRHPIPAFRQQTRSQKQAFRCRRSFIPLQRAAARCTFWQCSSTLLQPRRQIPCPECSSDFRLLNLRGVRAELAERQSIVGGHSSLNPSPCSNAEASEATLLETKDLS